MMSEKTVDVLQNPESELLPPLPELDLKNNVPLQEVMDLLYFTDEERESVISTLEDFLPSGEEQVSTAEMDDVIDRSLSSFSALGEVRSIMQYKDEDGEEISIPYALFRGTGVFIESIQTKTYGYLKERDEIDMKEGKSDKPRHTNPDDLDIIIPYDIKMLSGLSKKLQKLEKEGRVRLADPDNPVIYNVGQGSSMYIDKMWSRAFVVFEVKEPLEDKWVKVELQADHYLVAENKKESERRGEKVYQDIPIADVGMDWQKSTAADAYLHDDVAEDDFSLFRDKALLATYVSQIRESPSESRRDKASTRAVATLLAMEVRKKEMQAEKEKEKAVSKRIFKKKDSGAN